MFKEDVFNELVAQYRSHLEEFRSGELYKWEAVQCFQDNWNPHADNIAQMLDKAFGKAGTLLTAKPYFPIGMLVGFAERFPNLTLASLIRLFDESIDLKTRLISFERDTDDLLAQLNTTRPDNPAKNSFQDVRAMSVYLAFALPEKHFLYKYKVYKITADLLGVDCPKDKYDRLITYEELCRELIKYLETNHPDLIEYSDSLLPGHLASTDPNHHLLVQDILFFASEDRGNNEDDEDDLESESSIMGPGNWDTVSSISDNRAFWWLVAKPDIWSFDDFAIGEENYYTIYNEHGRQRRIHQNYLAAKPGDMIVGYEANPVKKVVSLCEVSREHDDERIYFKKVRDLDIPIPLTDIKDDPTLSSMQFFQNTKGSLFELTKEEYTHICELIEDSNEGSPVPFSRSPEPYIDTDFLSEVYVGSEALCDMKALLRCKKNLILQGSPGTGKTFAAERLAWTMMGEKDDSRVFRTQFHQSTSYEDFVCGYRPTRDGGFEMQEGLFVRVCERARRCADRDVFLIIDEINRANISKVLGEMLMLIEAGHRDEPFYIPLLNNNNKEFIVPSNLYIIGMMNTADRSLALIDYALRRRFAFFEMEPALDHPVFRDDVECSKDPRLPALVEATKRLNETIAADPSLGRGFRIGHSYFCGKDVDAGLVYRYELAPLIDEYWFDDAAKASDAKRKLEAALR